MSKIDKFIWNTISKEKIENLENYNYTLNTERILNKQLFGRCLWNYF